MLEVAANDDDFVCLSRADPSAQADVLTLLVMPMQLAYALAVVSQSRLSARQISDTGAEEQEAWIEREEAVMGHTHWIHLAVLDSHMTAASGFVCTL